MTLPAYDPTEASLFGEAEKAPEPKVKMGFGTLLGELFTEPVQLFKKLKTVSGRTWVMPLVVAIAMSLLFVGLWAAKVDGDAYLRPILEANPKLNTSQIDNIIEMQARFILPMGLAGAFFGNIFNVFFFGLLFWVIALLSREEERPTYMQGVTLTALGALVVAPAALLGALMCLLRPVGGLKPEQLMPSSLGFFIPVESPKWMAVLTSLEVFSLFSWVVIYLGARHYLKCKPWGAGLCVVLAALPVVFRVLSAR